MLGILYHGTKVEANSRNSVLNHSAEFFQNEILLPTAYVRVVPLDQTVKVFVEAVRVLIDALRVLVEAVSVIAQAVKVLGRGCVRAIHRN